MNAGIAYLYMKKVLLVIILLFVSGTIYAALQKFTIALDWFVNPDHAPLFVAKQQGYYKKQGLNVEFISPADPADPPKWVAAGKVDLAIDYGPQYKVEVQQGLPLKKVGTLIDQPLACIIVLKSSGIKSIKELKGKSIGYSVGGATETMLIKMLRYNGLILKEVKLINVHYDLSQALLAHRIDAAAGMMRNFELIQLELTGHPARAFYPEKNGVPRYAELIFATNKKKIHDPRIQKFLVAVTHGVKYLKQHPTETWKIFAKNHPELNNTLNRKAWFATLPMFIESQKH